jgi:hypothetical protein
MKHMKTHPVILLEPVFHFLDAVIRDYGLYIAVTNARFASVRRESRSSNRSIWITP